MRTSKDKPSDKLLNAIVNDGEIDIMSPRYTEDDISSPSRREKYPIVTFLFPEDPPRKKKCTFKCDLFMPIKPRISTRSLRSFNASVNNQIQSSPNLLVNILEEEENSQRFLSMWSAGFTIINMYLGLGLLSYPYAFQQGGLFSLVFLAVICCFMSWTGKLLVRCFIKMRPSQQTYIDVAKHSFGTHGAILISFGVIFEFFGGICMNMIFMWKNCKYLLDSLHFMDDINDSMILIALWSTVIVLPTTWMLHLSDMSFISFLGCLCKVFTVLAVVLCFFMNLDDVKSTISNEESSKYPNDLSAFSVCIGIFILSFAGHPILPGIYNSMKEPERFESLLNRCFVCLFFIYAVMGSFGYLLFGDDTSVIITENLMNQKGGKLTKIISQILVALVVLGLYFQISPINALLAEIPEMYILKIEENSQQRIFRTALCILCCFFSYVIMENLAALEAITGSICTMITSVICPSLFYWSIYRNYTSQSQRVMLILSVCVGVSFGLFLLFNDIRS